MAAQSSIQDNLSHLFISTPRSARDLFIQPCLMSYSQPWWTLPDKRQNSKVGYHRPRSAPMFLGGETIPQAQKGNGGGGVLLLPSVLEDLVA